jgi:hypothetical protein
LDYVFTSTPEAQVEFIYEKEVNKISCWWLFNNAQFCNTISGLELAALLKLKDKALPVRTC